MTLHNTQQGHAAILALWTAVKPWLFAGHKLVLSVKPETRSDAQNAMLHAILTDVSRQCEWAGKRWSVEEWKRLMTAAWCRTRNEGVQMIPAIDGQGFDVIYQRTSTLTKAECSDLCEFILAWGTERGVKWSDDARSS